MKNIAVIFGGCSPEYSVSLQSAYAVIRHIDTDRYNPILIGISKEGSWFLFNGCIDSIIDDTWCNTKDCTPLTVSLSRTEHDLLIIKEENVKKVHIDAAFPVLHGRNGEDGTVQGMFELMGVPVIGCGVLASALCMDKDRAHKLAYAAGVSVPESFVLTKGADSQAVMMRAKKIGFPLFVKPVKAGSSYGVTKVDGSNELQAAMDLAFKYDEEIIIEKCISGFEVGCAIMGKESLSVGEVDEIELTDGFFDYTEKYTLKTSAIHVPARVDSETSQRIKKAAMTIYKALDCSGFARVDMFLSDSGEIIFNEVNTVPGFTTHSRFPNMMKAAGISFEQIINTAIENSLSL